MSSENGISLSLYEMNKSVIAQLPAYTNDQIKTLQETLNKWDNTNYYYYMLLCNEAKYYTVFHKTLPMIASFSTLGEATIKLLLEAQYTIHEETEYPDRFEIWVKKDDETYVFILFPYDKGVVNYG